MNKPQVELDGDRVTRSRFLTSVIDSQLTIMLECRAKEEQIRIAFANARAKMDECLDELKTMASEIRR